MPDEDIPEEEKIVADVSHDQSADLCPKRLNSVAV